MKDKKPSAETHNIDQKDGPGGKAPLALPKEVNGFEALGLPEPTRYNDWDVKGRCSDF